MRQAASSNLTKETIKRNVQAIYKESLEQDTQHSSHKSGRGKILNYSQNAHLFETVLIIIKTK